jgi:hypothetical protein
MDVVLNNYTANNDTQYENDFNTSFIRTLNLNSQEKADPIAASNIVAYPGYTVDDIMTIESLFNNMSNDFEKATQFIKISNNLTNVNQFIDNSFKVENKRINHVLNDSINDVYLSRENFMLIKYNKAYQEFLTAVIQWSFFVAIVCAFFVCFTFYPIGKPNLSWKAAGSIIAIVLAIYLCGVVIFYKQTLIRRKDNWDKFYFNTPDSINGTVCNA